MGYAFISYKREEQSKADALRNIFLNNNIETWMDIYDIKTGENWDARINSAIKSKDCSCLVLILSNDAQNSVNIINEVLLAIKNNKFIIPIRTEPFELDGAMELHLQRKQIKDIRSFDENDSIIKSIVNDVISHTGTSKTNESKSNFLSGKHFLNRKQYNKALETFEKVIDEEPDNAEAYYYAAVCLLEGRIAFDHLRPEINKIIEFLNTAVAIKPKGIYYYFLAYIKKDYFERKYLNSEPNYKTYLNLAYNNNLCESEIKDFYTLLGVNRPIGL